MFKPSKHFPLKRIFCSSLNFSICSIEEKFISREIALHFRIFLGTLALKIKIFKLVDSNISYRKLI